MEAAGRGRVAAKMMDRVCGLWRRRSGGDGGSGCMHTWLCLVVSPYLLRTCSNLCLHQGAVGCSVPWIDSPPIRRAIPGSNKRES